MMFKAEIGKTGWSNIPEARIRVVDADPKSWRKVRTVLFQIAAMVSEQLDKNQSMENVRVEETAVIVETALGRMEDAEELMPMLKTIALRAGVELTKGAA